MRSTQFQGKWAAESPTRRWQKRFVIVYLVVAIVFAACFAMFALNPINSKVVERQNSNLISTAQAEANALEYVDDAQEFTKKAAEGSDLRITLIAQDGTVIADSEVDPATLENHLGREEVDDALHGKNGKAQRLSSTDDTNRLYVAVPATYQGERTALRVSEPSTVITTAADATRNTALIICGLGIISFIAIALFTYRESKAPLKKFDQVRSDFVANASHELKTPVAGIRLLSEAIRDASDVGDEKSLHLFIDRLDNEAERLQRLVIDLLDLSRLEEQQNSDRMPRTDLHSTLTTSYLAHKGEAEDKGIDLVLDDRSTPSDNCYASIEPSDASLIFDNLIENAIMYTDEGSILVSLESRAHETVVTVKDTGIGIPQADQSRIFERFYRVNKARSREVGGTGLGLSLVRHAIERGNGSIEVDSAVGQGTEFTVHLPKLKQE
jgi:signal transduction histidine kinase